MKTGKKKFGQKWKWYGEFQIDLKKGSKDEFAIKGEDSISPKKESGVYWVCLDGVSINRFSGTDPDGTLVIGKSINLERRFGDFKRGIIKASGHSPANLLSYIFWLSKSARKHMDKKIVIYYQTFSKDDIDKEERSNIIWYIKKYGEPPVLNSAIPDRYGSWRN